MKVILLPIPGYPISMVKASSSCTFLSLYKEDRSLEIDFMSLIDVRRVRKQISDSIATDTSKKTHSGEVGQPSMQNSSFKASPFQKMKDAATTSKNWSGNTTNVSSNEEKPSSNWDSLLSGSSTCTTKVASPAAENALSQGRNWDEIKSTGNIEGGTSSEGWPKWESRGCFSNTHLANTSWSFIISGPSPRLSGKRRSNNGNNTVHAPWRSNRYKG